MLLSKAAARRARWCWKGFEPLRGLDPTHLLLSPRHNDRGGHFLVGPAETIRSPRSTYEPRTLLVFSLSQATILAAIASIGYSMAGIGGIPGKFNDPARLNTIMSPGTDLLNACSCPITHCASCSSATSRALNLRVVLLFSSTCNATEDEELSVTTRLRLKGRKLFSSASLYPNSTCSIHPLESGLINAICLLPCFIR